VKHLALILAVLGFVNSACAQKITSFEISNGWGGWYHSEYEKIFYSNSGLSDHTISNSTIEINQPGNKCTILGYPRAPNYIPVDANVVDAIYFYDSLTKASEFEIRISSKVKKELNYWHNRFYSSDVDFTQFPFMVDLDTTAILEPSLLPKTNEIYYIMDGIGASFSCTIVFDHKDTVTHGIHGNYDLSNSMYLDTTLPIYCFFQQYPDVFKEQNYFPPVKESDMGEIIFRFIRWKKEEEKKAMEGGTNRSNIQIGSEVEIVEKHNQRSGELTDGFVQRILTKSSNHPHGIKVLLETGEVGRVKRVISEPLDDID
jgi:uncharacterized repeat protein (TIGR03833 family)